MSYLPISAIGGQRGVGLSGNWGWTDPETGKDYALVGRTDGTSFVDVTDPARPRYLGNLPKTAEAQATSWREIKTLKHYALIVSDASGPHGVQIFDMHRLRGVKTPQEFTPDVTYDKVASVHDILTNEESMFAYAVGSNGPGENCGGGYHMIDMRDPLKPTFAGCHADKRTGRSGTGYSHDALCQVYRGPDTRYQGKEICLGSNETAISIADFSDKKNPTVLGLATYPDVGYTHQGWWSEDMRYFYLNDELDETGGKGDAAKATRTLIFDFAKLDDPVFVGPFLGTSKASDHNLYVKGNRMYQSNYKAGLRIIDITNPTQPREVGFFDVEPGENSPGFSGDVEQLPVLQEQLDPREQHGRGSSWWGTAHRRCQDPHVPAGRGGIRRPGLQRRGCCPRHGPEPVRRGQVVCGESVRGEHLGDRPAAARGRHRDRPPRPRLHRQRQAAPYRRRSRRRVLVCLADR
jgi:choice-of-anchor B domain-containing protein